MHHLSHLSKPQATVLALWSFGMVLARSCALTAVSRSAGDRDAAQGADGPPGPCANGTTTSDVSAAPSGKHSCVETCFAPLLGWVVSGWQGTQLALAIDATTLGQRFVVLAVSAVYRGCAIPVAWVVLPAGAKHAWRREWLCLLRRLRPAIPPGWTVIVLADRGLYAPWLFRRITRLGWHPFLRIKRAAVLAHRSHLLAALDAFGAPARDELARHRARLYPQPGGLHVAGPLGRRLQKPLAAPDGIGAGGQRCRLYGLRAWIEQGFKITKRAGWQWHRTRMHDPERAARLWLAVAVATLWLLSVGGAAEETIPVSTLLDVTGVCPERPRTRRATRLRLVSVFRQGWVRLLVALLRQDPLPAGRFVPEPWPVVPPLGEEVCELALAMPEAA